MKPKYYLTTPIYYANSRPHVGSAYTTIVCDVIARYKRMCGYESPTSPAPTSTASTSNAPRKSRESRRSNSSTKTSRSFAIFGSCSASAITDFVRTTSPEHARAVQTLVRRTMERDNSLPAEKRSIYKAKYEGRYCIYDNLYVSDTPEPANCQICGRPAELISEENYFFRLSDYQERLLDLYKNAAGIRSARFSPQRSAKLRRKRPERRFDQPQDHQVGHSLARTIPSTFFTSGTTR